MKSGLTVGTQAEVLLTVTDAMRPQFDGVVVHDLYSTAAMVHQMEHAARKILLPFLEAHEEGMGVSVTVHHLAPARVGAQVRAVATVEEFSPRKIVTSVIVVSGETRIGEGTVVQAVLPKAKIRERLAGSQKE